MADLTHRKPVRFDAGSLSVTALILVFFFTAVISGGIYLGINVFRRAAIDPLAAETIALADKMVATIVEELEADETPEIDGPINAISHLETVAIESIAGEPFFTDSSGAISTEAVSIEIDEISSRLNPNTLRKWIFDDTRLSILLQSEGSTERLQQLRFDSGPTLDVEALYGSELKIADNPALFTGYGLFGINVTDEFVLENLVEARTGDERYAREVRLKLQNELSRQSQISSEALSLMVSGQDNLWPLLTSEPIWNIHFIPEEILRAILEHEPFGIGHPDRKADYIIERRKTSEIDRDDLAGILEVEAEHRVLEFLGPQSWFWQVNIEISGLIATYILFSSPAEAPFSESRSYLTIERYFVYNNVEI